MLSFQNPIVGCTSSLKLRICDDGHGFRFHRSMFYRQFFVYNSTNRKNNIQFVTPINWPIKRNRRTEWRKLQYKNVIISNRVANNRVKYGRACDCVSYLLIYAHPLSTLFRMQCSRWYYIGYPVACVMIQWKTNDNRKCFPFSHILFYMLSGLSSLRSVQMFFYLFIFVFFFFFFCSVFFFAK